MTTLSFEVQIFVQRMEKLLQTATDELHEKFDHIERKRDEKGYRKNKRDDREHERIVRKEERMKRKIPSFEKYWENLVKDKIQGNVGEKEKEEGLVHEEKKEGIEKDENFKEEERFRSDEKESGEQNKKIFLHNPLSFDADLDLGSNPFQEEDNDAKMNGLITWKADSVRTSMALVPSPHLKHFFDPKVGKLFLDFDLKFHDVVKDNQDEEARIVFDPGNWIWSHSSKKRYPKSKFLLKECYEDLRTNHFEEGEYDAIMNSLSMWKEAYKEFILKIN